MIETVSVADDYGQPASPDWRETDWSTHERDLLVNDRRVHYVEAGEGSTGFILVHGLGARWQFWLETLPFLARRGRVIALDLPGFGRSEQAARPVSLDGFVDTAAELCRAVGLESVVFFGHSMGGPIAVRFAARHPDLARAIVLVGGAVYTFSSLLGLPNVVRLARTRPRETTATFSDALTIGIPLPQWLLRLMAERPLLRRVALLPYVHRLASLRVDTAKLIVEGAGAPGVAPTVRAIGRAADPFEGLTDVGCPIMSIGGRHDYITPPADVEAFERDAPGTTSVLLEGCGHVMMLERPGAFNSQLERFLTELPAE